MDKASTSSKAVDSSDLAAEGTLSSSSAAAAAAVTSWRPSQRVFGPYLPVVQANANPQSLRVVVRRPVSAPFWYCLLYSSLHLGLSSIGGEI